jgi:hypothetical protein
MSHSQKKGYFSRGDAFLRALAVGVMFAAGLAFGGGPYQSVTLIPFGSGDFRWRDVADNLYAPAYRNAYSYDQATVVLTYRTRGETLSGTVSATNLKPNFAYQVKLFGLPETDAAANERVGFSGRWWQEEWDGWAWSDGHNLNNKGAGDRPSPNDQDYLFRRNIPDPTSPTGNRFRFTGYRSFDHFVTDASGNATCDFVVRSSYHVLWKRSQIWRGRKDGPVTTHAIDPAPGTSAYDTDYRPAVVGIYGEWERLPTDDVPLPPGTYTVDFLLTEESFHSDLEWGGCWAHACRETITFTIRPSANALFLLR